MLGRRARDATQGPRCAFRIMLYVISSRMPWRQMWLSMESSSTWTGGRVPAPAMPFHAVMGSIAKLFGQFGASELGSRKTFGVDMEDMRLGCAA